MATTAPGLSAMVLAVPLLAALSLLLTQGPTPAQACSTAWTPPSEGKGPFLVGDTPNDDTTITVDFGAVMPQGFPFYGTTYTTICVSPNGWLYVGACQVQDCPVAAAHSADLSAAADAAAGPLLLAGSYGGDLFSSGGYGSAIPPASPSVSSSSPPPPLAQSPLPPPPAGSVCPTEYTASYANALAIANGGLGLGLIAPLFTDLYNSGVCGHNITWGVGVNPESGLPSLAVTWTVETYMLTGGCDVQFQVTLTTDGNIAFQYNKFAPGFPCNGGSMFIGVLAPALSNTDNGTSGLVPGTVVHGLVNMADEDGFFDTGDAASRGCLRPCNGYFAAERAGLVRCGNYNATLVQPVSATPPADYNFGHCAVSVFQVYGPNDFYLDCGYPFFVLFEAIDTTGQAFCGTCISGGESNPVGTPIGHRFCSSYLPPTNLPSWEPETCPGGCSCADPQPAKP